MTNKKLDGILKKRRGMPGALIPTLQEAQETFGYLAHETLEGIADGLGIPFSKVFGVATFYTAFRFNPIGRKHVCLCRGTACHVKGAEEIREHIERHLNIKEGNTTEDGEYSLETVACIGCCALAPCLTINQEVHGRLSARKAVKILKAAG